MLSSFAVESCTLSDGCTLSSGSYAHSDRSDCALATSPFKLGSPANVRIGVASITAAEEAVKLCWEMQTLHKQPDQAAEAAAKALVSLVQSRASKHSYATDDTTVQVLFLNI